ncbi:hypothetical protein IX326_001850 [Porphyromonas levii]|nr:hypothetical protein [Porphyromonas levii]
MFHNKLILDDLNIATQRRGSPPYNNFLYAICLFCITICSSMKKRGGANPHQPMRVCQKSKIARVPRQR